MRTQRVLLPGILLCTLFSVAHAEIHMVGDRVDVEQKTEVRYDVPDGCVVTGVGFRAHADNITTMHLRYHRLTPAGELINPATVHVGAEPDHACEAEIYLPEGYVMVGFGAGAAPEWDIRTLRVWGRPLLNDGTLGEAEVFEDGRSPKDGLERTVLPAEPDRVLVGAGLRLVLHDVAGIYGRTRRVLSMDDQEREKLSGMSVRGWLVDRATPDFVEKVIDRAAGSDINALLLACQPAGGKPAAALRDALPELTRQAAIDGIDLYLFLGDEEFGRGLEIENLLEDNPKLRGLVLELPIGSGDSSGGHPSLEDVGKIAGVCDGLGRTLMVGVNVVDPGQIDEAVAAALDLPESVVILFPATAGNGLDPYYPPNPLFERLAGRRMIAGIDLSETGSGVCLLPYARPGEIQSRFVTAGLAGADGAIAAIGEPGHSVFGSVNEFNLWAFSKLLEDPLRPLNPLWEEYFGAEYGDAADRVISAYRRTRSAVNMTYHVERMSFISEASRIPGIGRAEKRLRGGLAEWRPGLEPVRQELLNPTMKVLDRAMDEKEIVGWLMKQSIPDIESVSGKIPEQDYETLIESFRLLDEMALLWRDWTRVYFLTQIYARDASGRTLGMLEGAVDELKERFAATQEKVGEEFSLANIDSVVAEVNRQIEETKKSGPIVQAFRRVEDLEEQGKPEEAAQALYDLVHDERFVPYLHEHNERLAELTSRMEAFGGPHEKIMVKRGADGNWDIDEKNGRWCWASTPQNVVVYFDALYGPYEEPKNFVLSFEYFDQGENDLSVHYDSDYPGGAEDRQYHPAGPFEIENTGMWKDATVILDKALFKNSQNVLADLRFIQGGDILRVRNLRLTPVE